MKDWILHIGNKNYSSWSLRSWLVLRACGIDFDEVIIPLDREETQEELRRVSPAGLVPVLRHKDLYIHDSLAIGEYVHELFPDLGLLPSDGDLRARVRSCIAEMHSGFHVLRAHLPMNVRRIPLLRSFSSEVRQDVDRLLAMWRSYLSDKDRDDRDGGFLLGSFSLIDAVFAPVVVRFLTYEVACDDLCRGYMDLVWNMPDMKSWRQAAAAEPYIIEAMEV